MTSGHSVSSTEHNTVKLQQFLRENPEVRKALDLFQVSQEQYAKALEATLRPGVRISNSTND